MPSYVEQAILRVKDESSSKVKKINRALKDLFRTARNGRNIKINVTGDGAALRKVNAVKTAIRSLPRSRTSTIRAKVTGLTAVKNLMATTGKNGALSARTVRVKPVLTGKTAFMNQLKRLLKAQTVAVTPRATPGVTPRPAPARTPRPPLRGAPALRGPLGALSTTPFPGNIPTAFNIAAAYMTVRAASIITRSAVTAATEGQTEETSRDLIFGSNSSEGRLIERVARDAALNSTGISLTRAEKIARDAFVVGFRGDTFEKVVPHIARLEAAALALAPDKAESITTLINKLGNLGAVTEDPKRALEITTAAFQAAAIQGETFNASSLISSLRVAGIAQQASAEGLLRFALAQDELGRFVGSGVARLRKLLTVDIKDAGAGGGVAKGTVERLIASGVRGDRGLTPEERKFFESNPLQFIADFVKAEAAAKGLDATNVDDRAAVSQLLTDFGFVGQEVKAILNEVSADAERQKAIPLGLSVDAQRLDQAAADDLGFQIRDLAQQFNTFASETLDPLFSALAPAASSVSQFVKELALAEGSGAQLKRVGFAAGAAATALGLVVGTSKLLSLLSPNAKAAAALTGSAARLTGAAVALERAAAAQGASSRGAPTGGVMGNTPGSKPGAGTRIPGVGLFSQLALLANLYTLGTKSVEEAAGNRRWFQATADSLGDVVENKLPTFLADIVNADRTAARERSATIAAAEARGATVEEVPKTFWDNALDALRGVPAPNRLKITEPGALDKNNSSEFITAAKAFTAGVVEQARVNPIPFKVDPGETDVNLARLANERTNAFMDSNAAFSVEAGSALTEAFTPASSSITAAGESLNMGTAGLTGAGDNLNSAAGALQNAAGAIAGAVGALSNAANRANSGNSGNAATGEPAVDAGLISGPM